MVKQKFPEPVVGAFIFNQEGDLFLMKSHKWNNKYVVPGGHVELGENLKDALEREVKEETGLTVYDIKSLNVQECVFDKSFFRKRHFIFHNFVCKTRDSNVQLNEEAQEHIWVSPKEALTLPLNSFTKQTIEKHLL